MGTPRIFERSTPWRCLKNIAQNISESVSCTLYIWSNATYQYNCPSFLNMVLGLSIDQVASYLPLLYSSQEGHLFFGGDNIVTLTYDIPQTLSLSVTAQLLISILRRLGVGERPTICCRSYRVSSSSPFDRLLWLFLTGPTSIC